VRNNQEGGVRRQWGGDRRRDPLSALPPYISESRVNVGRLVVVITIAAWLAYFGTWLVVEFISPQRASSRSRVEAIAYLLVVTLLTASAVAYLVCRLGFFYRSRDHQRVPKAAIDQFYARSNPSLTVIIPSYKEESRVVRNTLLSAALQEYRDLRVVLLIDDPPNPKSKRDRAILDEARDLPRQIESLLAEPHAHLAAALERFLAVGPGARATISDMTVLAGLFEYAVNWLHGLADTTEIVDHTDRFFADHVVLGLAADFSVTATALRSATEEEVILPRERLIELYRRLDRTFQAELSSFERKQYASLSHESNKAMNLNSYIGLMGGCYQDVETVSGRVLLPSPRETADLVVPDPDYVLTLDADSILLPEYCVRLVYLMEQSQHARYGVAQTPYSAYPGAATRLERIAGASTDLQHIVHQGMTHYQATFWVGANAVLRKRALDDIRETSYLGNWEVHRYIQDRTVIEDTESTIDLRTHGWQLVNYPERLSYSATPPDFGSLCIQRRRWANGGLLILPKLRRQQRSLRQLGVGTSIGERLLRLNYMASICWSSFSLLLLLAYPFRNELVSPFLGLIALPYFFAMASDLRLCGYKRLDVLRIYGFNLVLLPVNLSGVTNSVVQALTGDKSVFGRTPKVRDRTVPNFLFIFTPYLVVALAAYTLVRDYHGHRWDNLVYAGINTLLASYAILAFIGIRYSIVDTWVHFKARLYKPVKRPTVLHQSPASILANPSSVDWASVLHFGGPDFTGGPRRTGSDPLGAPVEEPIGSGLGSLGVAVPLLDRASIATAGGIAEFRTVFQPIVDLDGYRAVGYEALTRFDDGVAPDRRLAEIAGKGGGIELEMLLTRAGIRAAELIPPDAWLALNVSVDLVEAGRALSHILEPSPREVVLEIRAVDLREPERFAEAVAALPGVAVSLTGVEASYESLTLVRQIGPRFVKLERGWLAQLATDPARQALVTALVTVSAESGLQVIAEGIESAEELEVLRRLGVRLGQGFLLGRPSRLPAGIVEPEVVLSRTGLAR
jgi:EAL domain-containing protein (putative c-di-GMP-specific phosphodiesterase class I)/cellulose synthase/poly-beta-1,6-N-acetylglucosamine synthase-like glycosyltransferase